MIDTQKYVTQSIWDDDEAELYFPYFLEGSLTTEEAQKCKDLCAGPIVMLCRLCNDHDVTTWGTFDSGLAADAYDYPRLYEIAGVRFAMETDMVLFKVAR